MWVALFLGITVMGAGCTIENKSPSNKKSEKTEVTNKVDLLLVIDNSRSMADKQALLKTAVPSLVTMLVNPRCLDSKGAVAAQPSSPDESCPDSTTREIAPVHDMHIGIVSSAIGSHGADACDAKSIPSENDKAHLLVRSSTELGASPVPTWSDKGFLVWDPNNQHVPQGMTDSNALTTSLSAMIGGVGEVGCGFEAPLEAWYRFLMEPDPHESIAL